MIPLVLLGIVFGVAREPERRVDGFVTVSDSNKHHDAMRKNIQLGMTFAEMVSKKSPPYRVFPWGTKSAILIDPEIAYLREREDAAIICTALIKMGKQVARYGDLEPSEKEAVRRRLKQMSLEPEEPPADATFGFLTSVVVRSEDRSRPIAGVLQLGAQNGNPDRSGPVFSPLPPPKPSNKAAESGGDQLARPEPEGTSVTLRFSGVTIGYVPDATEQSGKLLMQLGKEASTKANESLQAFQKKFGGPKESMPKEGAYDELPAQLQSSVLDFTKARFGGDEEEAKKYLRSMGRMSVQTHFMMSVNVAKQTTGADGVRRESSGPMRWSIYMSSP